jgi:hypothetical protein
MKSILSKLNKILNYKIYLVKKIAPSQRVPTLFGYVRPMSCRLLLTYAVFPLNHILKWYYKFKHLIAIPSKKESKIIQERIKLWNEGFDKGFDIGYTAGKRKTLHLTPEQQKTLKSILEGITIADRNNLCDLWCLGELSRNILPTLLEKIQGK